MLLVDFCKNRVRRMARVGRSLSRLVLRSNRSFRALTLRQAGVTVSCGMLPRRSGLRRPCCAPCTVATLPHTTLEGLGCPCRSARLRQLRSAKDRAEDVPPRPGMVATFRLRSTSVDDLLFDVDAFLAAARSCLDFAASVIAPHLGMDCRTSMTTLLKSHMNVTHCSFAVLPRWRSGPTALDGVP